MSSLSNYLCHQPFCHPPFPGKTYLTILPESIILLVKCNPYFQYIMAYMIWSQTTFAIWYPISVSFIVLLQPCEVGRIFFSFYKERTWTSIKSSVWLCFSLWTAAKQGLAFSCSALQSGILSTILGHPGTLAFICSKPVGHFGIS